MDRSGCPWQSAAAALQQQRKPNLECMDTDNTTPRTVQRAKPTSTTIPQEKRALIPNPTGPVTRSINTIHRYPTTSRQRKHPVTCTAVRKVLKPRHQDSNPSIISTESGLSYTNLDYGPVSNASNNLYLNSHQNLYHSSESYPRSNPHEMMVHRHHGDLQENQTLGHQNHFLAHDSKYLPQIGCENEPTYQQIVMQNSAATNACMEYPHHRYKEDPGLPSADGTGDCVQAGHILHHRPHHGLHHLQPAPAAPTVPTYKWMQVKRNVPKPAETTIRRATLQPSETVHATLYLDPAVLPTLHIHSVENQIESLSTLSTLTDRMG
ncbi:hypothetical protein CBL_05340 [Carabus blaptoides fortunei]